METEWWGHPKELEEYWINGYDQTGSDFEGRVQILSYSDEQNAHVRAYNNIRFHTYVITHNTTDA